MVGVTCFLVLGHWVCAGATWAGSWKAIRVLLSVLNCLAGHIQILDLYAMLDNIQAVKPLCLSYAWFSTGY